jgi:hypothetical protein
VATALFKARNSSAWADRAEKVIAYLRACTSETSLKDAPPYTVAVAAVWRRECNPRSVMAARLPVGASGGKKIVVAAPVS